MATNDGKAEDKVFSIAWMIAGKILSDRVTTNRDYRRLKNAISKAPLYKTTYDDAANWDGIF